MQEIMVVVPDICLDENNYHDSLQARLLELAINC